jgi:hypothetical protein
VISIRHSPRLYGSCDDAEVVNEAGKIAGLPESLRKGGY